jgi:hypothetical protein
MAVPNTTQFAAIITPQTPNSNNKPPKVPGQKNMIIAVNARSYIPTVIDSQGSVKQFAPPTVIDSQGSVKQFAPPTAAYTMIGI